MPSTVNIHTICDTDVNQGENSKEVNADFTIDYNNIILRQNRCCHYFYTQTI